MKNAHFFHHAYETEIIARRFVVDTEPEFVASRILCCKVFGPKVQRAKCSEGQRFVGKRFVEVRSRSICPGMISGFCSTDLLTA